MITANMELVPGIGFSSVSILDVPQFVWRFVGKFDIPKFDLKKLIFVKILEMK